MALLLSPEAPAKALYGAVTAVGSAEVVTLDHGAGQYQVKIYGIAAPAPGEPFAQEAKALTVSLVDGKKVRIRFKYRDGADQMVSRLWVDQVDVAVALVRGGLARSTASDDVKYPELKAAEDEARASRRGIWSLPAPSAGEAK